MEWHTNNPKTTDLYLVTLNNPYAQERCVDADWFNAKISDWTRYGNYVVAWAELPEPYKE